jgi:hypothetical protein
MIPVSSILVKNPQYLAARNIIKKLDKLLKKYIIYHDIS